MAVVLRNRIRWNPSGKLVPRSFPVPSKERPLILLSREVPELMLEDRVLSWKRKRPMLFGLAGSPGTYYVSFPVRMGNPSERAAPSHAGLFHAFTGETPKGMSPATIMVPGPDVYEVGRLKAIEYVSPKEFKHSGGRKSHPRQRYVHELSRPYSKVYVTRCGGTYVIHGGAMRIGKDDKNIAWLED